MNNIARIIEDIRNDPDDHKDYESYNEGWIDACNRIAAVFDSSSDRSDQILRNIREKTPRYRMSVIVSTDDCCIDNRMDVIWSVLNPGTEILESVSIPQKLPPLGIDE